jgi:hypothetical protein
MPLRAMALTPCAGFVPKALTGRRLRVSLPEAAFDGHGFGLIQSLSPSPQFNLLLSGRECRLVQGIVPRLYLHKPPSVWASLSPGTQPYTEERSGR